MTHPFHPWRGREFVLVGVQRNWSQDRVFFLDDQGVQYSLPVRWTDAVAVDPFVEAAGGRCAFRVADLVALAGLIDTLRSGHGSSDVECEFRRER